MTSISKESPDSRVSKKASHKDLRGLVRTLLILDGRTSAFLITDGSTVRFMLAMVLCLLAAVFCVSRLFVYCKKTYGSN